MRQGSWLAAVLAPEAVVTMTQPPLLAHGRHGWAWAGALDWVGGGVRSCSLKEQMAVSLPSGVVGGTASREGVCPFCAGGPRVSLPAASRMTALLCF